MKCKVAILLLAMLPLALAQNCRAKTSSEARADRLVAAGCPDATPSGCECTGHQRSTYECPASTVTGWASDGKTCVTARPDVDSTWAKHDWDYPGDYWTYCPPTNGSMAGSPDGLSYWPEPGSYDCTKVAGETHPFTEATFDPSSAGYLNTWDAESWCTTPGCWVDPCTCDMEDVQMSSWFQGTDGPDVYYSYAMCGGTNTFTEALCSGNDDSTSCNAVAGCIWEAPSPGSAPAPAPAAGGITCDTGTLYSDCSGYTNAVTEAYDCGGSYDQCYTWTYVVEGGCDYQTKGCDLSTSSWCGESYQNLGYTATCCDSDNCNRDVAFGAGGSSGSNSGSDVSSAFRMTASMGAMMLSLIWVQ